MRRRSEAATGGQAAPAAADRPRLQSAHETPSYCAWWVPDGHTPTYPEAIERVTHLKERGPTPESFDFRTAFDLDGHPVNLDRVRAAILRKPILRP